MTTSDSIGLMGTEKALTLVHTHAQSWAAARKGSTDSEIGALVKEQAAILG